MNCCECHERQAMSDRDHCFRCHLKSLGWSFRGVGYGKDAWHSQTIAERLREVHQNETAQRV